MQQQKILPRKIKRPAAPRPIHTRDTLPDTVENGCVIVDETVTAEDLRKIRLLD